MPLSTCFCRSPGIIPPFLRAGPTEKIALELALCLEAVEKINQLWEMSEDEDKQGMARNLFSYITYDLDAQRIVDFRLKPWADRFVTLRAALYEGDSNENLPSSEAQGEGKPVTPTGLGGVKLSWIEAWLPLSSSSSSLYMVIVNVHPLSLIR
jgi:hypothetical protein